MIFTTAFGNIIRAEGVVKESMTGNLLSTVTNMLLYIKIAAGHLYGTLP